MEAPRRGIGALREYFYGEGIGRAAMEPRDPIVVGRMGRWRVIYRVGPRGIRRGGGLRFTPPNGFSAPRFEDMTAPGYCVCAGMSGHGFKLAPAVGEMMAELSMTGSCEEPDIGDYRLARFEEGSLMRIVFGTGFQG